MRQSLGALWREKDGQDMVEYALLLAFVVLGAAGVLSMSSAPIKTIASVSNAQLANGVVAAGT